MKKTSRIKKILTPYICKVASHIYRREIETRGVLRQRWRRRREMMVGWFNDPPCVMEVHQKALWMPLSHMLPLILRTCPDYDRLPARLAEFLRRRDGKITCVDVGANIGDTLAGIVAREGDCCIAVEPNAVYVEYLKKNWDNCHYIHIEQCLLGEVSRAANFVLRQESGTASFESSDAGEKMVVYALDDLMDKSYGHIQPNFLKIDTDGHDLSVIQGARATLMKSKPAILFECGVNPPPDFIDQAISTLQMLGRTGYDHVLMYDNYGRLMGRYSTGDTATFRNLLIYQQCCSQYYYDLLAIRAGDMDDFYQSEIDFFSKRLSAGRRA